MLDTNVVVSGLLWGGHSRRLLELAMADTIALYSSPELMDELSQTLHYAKLAKRIAALQTTAHVGWAFAMPGVKPPADRVRPLVDVDGRVGGSWPFPNSLAHEGSIVKPVFGLVAGVGTTF